MDRTSLERQVRFLRTGLLAMFIIMVGMIALQFIRPASGASSTGTCLPISKGGSGCDAAAMRNYLGLGSMSTLNSPLPVANGGTGQTTVAAARNSFGLGNTTGALPVANGGTGATTAPVARTNLGLGDISTKNLLELYPVGAIFVTTANTNPGTFLGGTWAQFGQGRTLIGMGNNGTTNYTTVQDTGGIDTQTHSLSNGYAQITVSATDVRVNRIAAASPWTANYSTSASGAASSLTGTSFATALAGSTDGADNRSAYITVYFWRRSS